MTKKGHKKSIPANYFSEPESMAFKSYIQYRVRIHVFETWWYIKQRSIWTRLYRYGRLKCYTGMYNKIETLLLSFPNF